MTCIVSRLLAGRRVDSAPASLAGRDFVARELARGMGGEITVESELGTGSTFTLSLPSVFNA